ncbi:unnamed protein product [Vitrella brassicaformis CCMP3155]|uniref:Uncharacterized protein n=1 Tax=Vitrella brassicaformis (strain CCMP3155) TaxID=1169540 RepID=A0A0G4EPF4_VITBC|nr:unnamed protein product [Vitrella brassicaformis CCMP3155]|eukprot:CEL99314.1 unnamed protein product [Vitrella brassicaformis CCMP3155]
MDGPCQMKSDSEEVVRILGISPHLLDSSHDKCFCPKCYDQPANQSYTRGEPPVPYMPPVGWYWLGIKLTPEEARRFNEGWVPAYHGTKRKNVEPIVESRALRVPTSLAEKSGAWAGTGRGMSWRDFCRTYPGEVYCFCSPHTHTAVGYAEHFWVSGQDFLAVFQLLVDPGAFVVNDGMDQTVSSRASPSTAPMHPMWTEWKSNKPGRNLVYGLLVCPSTSPAAAGVGAMHLGGILPPLKQGGGHRLGGESAAMRGLTARQAAARAAEKRLADNPPRALPPAAARKRNRREGDQASSAAAAAAATGARVGEEADDELLILDAAPAGKRFKDSGAAADGRGGGGEWVCGMAFYRDSTNPTDDSRDFEDYITVPRSAR